MPQRRRLHHGWTWVTPPVRRQASICCCAVCVLWAQLKGVEVDDHPAFGSYWDDAFAKLSALPNLRHWLGSLNGGRQGAMCW